MSRKKKIEEKNVGGKNKEPVLGNLDKLEFKLNLNKKNNTNLEKSEDVEEAEDEDESELEEDVDDSNLNLQSLEFHQFMELSKDSADSGAPVLERIAGSQPRPIFVGGVPRDTSSAGTRESGEESKYVSENTNAGEPKYFSEPGANAPKRVDLAQAGRTDNFREEINQERFFMQSEPTVDSSTFERLERPERFDIERESRKSPFEREEKKYKPKLPKG